MLFFAYQMTFAVITPALILGAWVERAGFGFTLLFTRLWMIAVYVPWRIGSGAVVSWPMAGSLAAMLGARRNKTTPPHSPGMVMIGAGMLWVGWFGFNGGSALAANGQAALGLTNTHLSASAATLTWALWERIKFGRVSTIGLVTGTVAGLASITPAPGFVTPWQALVIGAIAGVLCQEAVVLVKHKIQIDDTLDVFGVHGVGGIFGTVMVAAFGAGSWTAQSGGLVLMGLWTGGVSYVLAKLAAWITPIRVDAETEVNGLDLSVHGERAYEINS
jgi:Amt family ammonium transporter